MTSVLLTHLNFFVFLTHIRSFLLKAKKAFTFRNWYYTVYINSVYTYSYVT